MGSVMPSPWDAAAAPTIDGDGAYAAMMEEL